MGGKRKRHIGHNIGKKGAVPGQRVYRRGLNVRASIAAEVVWPQGIDAYQYQIGPRTPPGYIEDYDHRHCDGN